MPPARRNSIIDVVFVLMLRGLGMVLGIISAFGVVFLFGASPIVDAYFFARRTIGSIQSVAEVLIETLMVPAMLRHLKGAGVSSLIRLSTRLERLVFFGGAVFSVAACLCAGLVVDLLAPGLSNEARAPAILYFCLLLVTVPITLLTSVNSATLVAMRHFSRPAAARLLPRLFLVLALAAVPFGLGLHWAVVSFVIGTFLMMVVFQVMSRRILKQARAAAQMPDAAEAPSGALDMTARHSIATIVLGICAFVETTLDTFFASLTGVGALAILTLGQRISNIGASEMSRSLLSVYYANMSEHAAARQTNAFVTEVATAIRALLFFIAPLGFFLFALAAPLCAVLLDFGAFSAEAITLTSAVVAWVTLATVLRGPVAVQEYAILADPEAEHLAFATVSTVLSLLVRVAIVLVLMPWFGLISVVFSAVGATLFKLVFGFIWLRFRGGLVFDKGHLWQAAIVLCIAALAAGASAALVSFVPDGAGRLLQGMAIGFSVLLMTLIYVFVTASAGITEGIWLRGTLLKRLLRRK